MIWSLIKVIPLVHYLLSSLMMLTQVEMLWCILSWAERWEKITKFNQAWKGGKSISIYSKSKEEWSDKWKTTVDSFLFPFPSVTTRYLLITKQVVYGPNHEFVNTCLKSLVMNLMFTCTKIVQIPSQTFQKSVITTP